MERTQSALNGLADLHDQGTVSMSLSTLKTKTAIYDLVGAKLERVSNGYHDYMIDTGKPAKDSELAKSVWALLTPRTEAEKQADALDREIQSLQFANIPGYYPTPDNIIKMMLDGVDISPLCHILEPNGGSGAILDLVHSQYVNITSQTYEINHTLSEILQGKGYNVETRDFLSVEPEENADCVLMNPPFERLQDIDHVLHAYKFLKPGGTLVAIMSPGAFFSTTKKAESFKEWLSQNKGQYNDLPDNSFKASGTGVGTKRLTITKPTSLNEDVNDNPFICADYLLYQASCQRGTLA